LAFELLPSFLILSMQNFFRGGCNQITFFKENNPFQKSKISSRCKNFSSHCSNLAQWVHLIFGVWLARVENASRGAVSKNFCITKFYKFLDFDIFFQ